MLNYIIQIILFQVLFFIVYELMLKKETFFTGNRVYLIATQVLVLIIPILRFPSIQEKIPVEYQKAYTQSYYGFNKAINTSTTPINDFIFHWEWVIYLGVLISLTLLIIKLFNIHKIVSQGIKSNYQNIKIINLNDNSTAFSFWNYIIIGNQIPIKKQQEIIAHEEIHIKQKHSLDLFLFEILRVLFWFNPFIYLFQKRITEVHEFIVDKEISETKIEKKDYFNSILSEVFQTQEVSFTNSFYKASLIKKRIQMLTKIKSKDRQRLKYFFVVPIMVIAVSFVACNENSKQLAMLMDDSNWHSTNYKTGDAVKAFQYVPIFKVNNQYFLIKNHKINQDAVVKIYDQKSNQLLRDKYIKSGDSIYVEDLPKRNFYLKIAYGNNWKEKCIQNECFGKFFKDEEFQTIEQD